jgi:hypothetical protein
MNVLRHDCCYCCRPAVAQSSTATAATDASLHSTAQPGNGCVQVCRQLCCL